MEKQYANKYLIETGIGLQDVDGLKNSPYFLSESSRYIKGEISLDEFDRIIASYYAKKEAADGRSEEADRVAIRIAKVISEDAFTFTVGQLKAIHKTLFDGILQHPGEIRTYNFSKKEWILDGASVTYGDFRDLETTLQYDFELEKKFRYQGLSLDDTIEHLALFVSNMWQIHAFEEGNTRATAVFFIKYLRSLGFDVTNDSFAKHSWYFRNALVRANYTNVAKKVFEDRSFLIRFLRNLLLNEKNELKNREMHIRGFAIVNEETKENRILDLIKSDPHISSETLSKSVGVSVRTVKGVVKTLVDKKVIKRVNGKRYGYWEVKG